MKYRSTRNPRLQRSLSQAIQDGLAPDGGLYVPVAMPKIDPASFAGLDSIRDIAAPLLRPFFSGDPLSDHLDEILSETYDFPAPLVTDTGSSAPILELFHGPTAAFKDFGARFLAACLARVPRADRRPLTIIVATSGDTGGAVASAFHRRAGFRIVLLYPRGRVSALQERQLCCWDDNVSTFAVAGDFDDCQRLARQAFVDPALTTSFALSSANSINVGRLLGQMAAFAAASLGIGRTGARQAGFVIPSGNLGHALACIWARESALPIGGILLAHNANRAVPDYFADGRWRPRPSVATIASAMDVGDPSNMERLQDLYPEHETAVTQLRTASVDDAEIRARIQAEAAGAGRALCPHSAVAAEAWHRLPRPERERLHWVIVATAHAAKFAEIVEPLIGRRLAPPSALALSLARPLRRTEIAADFDALRAGLLAA
jgi:threonine synthase